MRGIQRAIRSAFIAWLYRNGYAIIATQDELTLDEAAAMLLSGETT